MRMHSVMSTVHVRAALASDASVIASIYNEGIAEREATFETEPRHATDFHEKIASERYPLLEESERRGFYKLLGKVFPENLACVRMVGRCGFREVGLHRCHGRLDGQWRDVLLLERLLGEALTARVDVEAPIQ